MVQSIYHLHPPSNWMNDPNGPVFVDGTLHMFYQSNPDAPVWGNMTWGHAVSPDMVHWKRLPYALHPDKPYDAQGVFSGCCVMKDGLPHILYTGVYPECVCLAVGDAKCETFLKYEGNPILKQPEEGRSGWRDPFVWMEGSEYFMALGAARRGEGTWVELYRSPDLIHWERMEDMAHSPEGSEDVMWECPNVLFGDCSDAAIVVSAVPGARMRLLYGTYEGGDFALSRIEPYDLGDCFYAPNTVYHPDGRLIQYAWMRECGDDKARAAQGWQGVMTLPREVSLQGGEFFFRPAREVKTLRGERLFFSEGASLRPGEKRRLAEGQFLEFGLSCTTTGPLLLEALSDDIGNCVEIAVDNVAGKIAIRFGALSGGDERSLNATYRPEETLQLRLFIDGTALELFINDREALATRAYPTPECLGLALTAQDGAEISELCVYEMRDAYL